MNKLKKHGDMYIHIKKIDWFIGWRVFWGIILSVVYWLIASFINNNNIKEIDKTFKMGIDLGITDMIFFIIGLTFYIMAIIVIYEEKFNKEGEKK